MSQNGLGGGAPVKVSLTRPKTPAHSRRLGLTETAAVHSSHERAPDPSPTRNPLSARVLRVHPHLPLGELLLGWLLSNVTIFLPLFRLASQVFIWCARRRLRAHAAALERMLRAAALWFTQPCLLFPFWQRCCRVSRACGLFRPPFRAGFRPRRFFSTDLLGHKLMLDLSEVGITWSGLEVFLAAVLLVRCRLGALSRSMVSCHDGACFGAEVRLAWGWWLGAVAALAGVALNILLDRLRVKARCFPCVLLPDAALLGALCIVRGDTQLSLRAAGPARNERGGLNRTCADSASVLPLRRAGVGRERGRGAAADQRGGVKGQLWVHGRGGRRRRRRRGRRVR